jgi:hypothetical protein
MGGQDSNLNFKLLSSLIIPNMGDTSTKVDTLLMIGIWDKYFHFMPVIMVLYIYKYWFKMLKR